MNTISIDKRRMLAINFAKSGTETKFNYALLVEKFSKHMSTIDAEEVEELRKLCAFAYGKNRDSLLCNLFINFCLGYVMGLSDHNEDNKEKLE